MTVLIRQVRATELDDVSRQLRDAFTTAREAIESDQPVVLVVDAPDLLGQGTLADAAVATGFLGLMRALTFEGGRKGWHVNVVAVDRGEDPTDDTIAAASSVVPLKGQVLNVSVGHIGKIVP